MIDRLPIPVWFRLIDYLGFIDFYQLRKINRYFKNRIDNEACVAYKRFQGKINIDISNYLNYPVTYPKLLLTEEDKEYFSIENIGIIYTRGIFSKLFEVIDANNFFTHYMRRIRLYKLDNKNLMKAIKLVQLGLSEHYITRCIELSNERLDWAITFTSLGLRDEFCFRGASEFNESQKNNLIRLKEYIIDDDFAFEVAESLTDTQIQTIIDNKIDNIPDYYEFCKMVNINV